MSVIIDLIRTSQESTRHLSVDRIKATFRQPVIIISAPRSGSNLLFEQLMRIPDFWTIGGESHAIFRAFPGLRAENAAFDSGCLGERHAEPQVRISIRSCFLYLVGDYRGKRYLAMPETARPATIRLLEKTPRNALNIPFLLKVFPDARFIYLHREPRQNVASLIEAWMLGLRTGRFVTYTDLPGWDRKAWCFLLPPGWRSMVGKSLADIAAFQWSASNQIILDGLTRLPKDRWTMIAYQALIDDPERELKRICRFAEVDAASLHGQDRRLPLSKTNLTPPDPEKWRAHEAEIMRLLPGLLRVAQSIREAQLE
jgi:hypothetical protein